MQTPLFSSPLTLPLDNAVVSYHAQWAPCPNTAFSELVSALNWQQRELSIYGRRCLTPRLVAWCADPGVHYSYSGDSAPRQNWPIALLRLRRQLENFCQRPFNGVLANYYRNGDDSMGWHSDDERSLGRQPCIASISLGEPRDFVFRSRHGDKQRHSICLEHGSLLLMQGETQQHWQHALPRRRRANRPRLNLTFRHIVD